MNQSLNQPTEAEKELMLKYKDVPSEVYYEPETGYVYRRSNNRRLVPDENNAVVVYISHNRNKFRLKLDRLCYFLAFGIYPDSKKRVLHKNLNNEDNSLRNIQAVPSVVYNKIVEAKLNLEHQLKIIPHLVYPLITGVRYKKDNQLKTRWCDDYGVAQILFKEKQLEYSKFLAKYTITD